MTATAPARSRLLATDVVRLGTIGLRTRPLRAALSAVGIAIGIASMVAVLGISQSSRADLIAQLDRLGTNLLTVQPGQSTLGRSAVLPRHSRPSIATVDGVLHAAQTVELGDLAVRTSSYIAPEDTNGIGVLAADPALAATVGGELAAGRFLDAATSRYPTIVLGAVAARRLGISRPDVQVLVGDRAFRVIGILRPVELTPELDAAALIGLPVARDELHVKVNPSRIYLRADTDRVGAVRGLLARTADPAHPEEVSVSRPSDVLAARAAAKTAFTALLVGLGAVALLVGGIGIANVMVISVLERRSEVGLRRALGATRRHVAAQFLSESLLLSALGGLAGVVLGALLTTTYAANRGWPAALPASIPLAGILAAMSIGGVAGLYPAFRAARLPPTEALRA